MRVLITGAGGQLGRELTETTPSQHRATALARSELDLLDAASVTAQLDRVQPQVVINTAAYTRVDAAESEKELAFAINAEAVGDLARAVDSRGGRFIHLSTDFVFGGQQTAPLTPADPAHPMGVYGASKLEGEKRVKAATGSRALILRTAWLYSRHGSNFVVSMLDRMTGGQALRVVADQIGTPTWARGLARALWKAVELPELRGIHHWTDAGVASWYDFAVAIQEESLAFEILLEPVPIQPIRSGEYSTPAPRPAYSVLDKTATWEALAMEPVHWREALRQMLAQVVQQRESRSAPSSGKTRCELTPSDA